MVLLATVATVIASQAVISGAFSLTRQAVQLGSCRACASATPRRARWARSTSRSSTGCVRRGARCSCSVRLLDQLASAYGIAVTGTIMITTLLFFLVMHTLAPAAAGLWAAAVFLAIDVAFFLANIDKIVTAAGCRSPSPRSCAPCCSPGGAAAHRHGEPRADGRPAAQFIKQLHDHEQPVVRVPGTPCSSTAATRRRRWRCAPTSSSTTRCTSTSSCCRSRRFRSRTSPSDERLEISDLGFRDDGISHITAHFGFQDRPNVTEVLREAESKGLECPLEVEDAAYFLSKIELLPSGEPGMAMWRKRLFVATANLAADPVEYFVLPRDRAVLIGSHLEF